jgi:hypothetical protein
VTPDQVVAAWPTAGSVEQYRLRQESLVVDCPRCHVHAGEPCGYEGAKIDSETGLTVGMQWITRSAHLERLAVFTDGRLYGYTLRKLGGAR